MSSSAELTEALKAEALRLGFDLVGIAPAVAPPHHGRYLDWLSLGHAAGMDYMHRQAEARSHPSHILDGVRSVIMTALSYHPGPPEPVSDNPRVGKVARYAQGEDYHEVFWRRLESLLDWLRRERPEIQGRAVCDSASLMERDFAVLAGLGWVGKNTVLINRRRGSFLLLGALLVDLELDYDATQHTSHCGTCTRCLDACPTDAFAGPYQLDAGKCLSYWTIEHRGPIPEPFAARLDGWAFGCDICQEVCPWNRRAPAGTDRALASRPEWRSPDLLEWLERDPVEFAKRLKGTALKRTKRVGLVRNAALILGRRRVTEASERLHLLLDDPDPGIREAVRLALGWMASSRPEAVPDPNHSESGPS